MKPQMITFCKLIAAGRHTNKAAAIEAGYSPRTAGEQASKLLRKVKIQEQIAEFKEQFNARVNIDADWIRNELISLHEKCSQAVPVLDKKGNPTGEYKIDSAGSNKALDTLNRMSGYYEKDNNQKAAQITIKTEF